MLAPAVALGTLLNACAPNIGPRTMTAIVRVESDGNPLSIHDNTSNVSFQPVDLVEAMAWSKALLLQHHSIDLGLAQINSANLPRLGMSLREAFDPCTNLRGGATILSSDYRSAVFQFGAGQYALRRAIGAYNTGSLFAGFSYVDKILRAAGIRAEDDFLVPDIASMSPAVAFPPIGPASKFAPAAPVRRRIPALAVRPRPPAPAATVAPVGAPILVTIGGPNAISPAGSMPAATVAPAAVTSRNSPVVLHLNAPADPATSPFSSPIALGAAGLPSGNAPIVVGTPAPAPVPVPATVPATK
jgi:type IV secretion system protein VirB1